MSSLIRSPASHIAPNLWALDPAVTHLNHAAFGATPRVVLEHQKDLRDRMEKDPSNFLHFQLPSLLAEARRSVAAFVGADPEGIVFVRSATEGLNTVLRSLLLSEGDEILIADHAHQVCVEVARTVATLSKAAVTTVRLPQQPTSEDALADIFLAGVTPRTRVAVVDHVTSASALMLPVQRIALALRQRGIISVVDGAHAPGMIDLSIDNVGADYYVGSLHKWACSPKGAGFIYALEQGRALLVPSVVARRGTYQERFNWTGTCDPTPWLCAATAITVVGDMMERGWTAIRSRNRDLALRGREIVSDTLGAVAQIPSELLGSMFSIHVMPPENCGLTNDEAQYDFRSRYGIHVRFARPIVGDGWLLRASAFLYNELSDYGDLAAALHHFGVRAIDSPS